MRSILRAFFMHGESVAPIGENCCVDKTGFANEKFPENRAADKIELV